MILRHFQPLQSKFVYLSLRSYNYLHSEPSSILLFSKKKTYYTAKAQLEEKGPKVFTNSPKLGFHDPKLFSFRFMVFFLSSDDCFIARKTFIPPGHMNIHSSQWAAIFNF